jgi:hypothetical protein
LAKGHPRCWSHPMLQVITPCTGSPWLVRLRTIAATRAGSMYPEPAPVAFGARAGLGVG